MSSGWFWPTGTGNFGGYLGWLGYNPGWGYHLAQDMKNAAGSPIYSIGDGSIISAGEHNGYGNYGNGKGGCVLARYQAADGTWFTAMYGHLDNYKTSGSLAAGEIVGYTLPDWNPPHLHFSVHPGHDPEPNNPWRGYTSSTGQLYGFTDPIPFLNAHPRSAGGNGVGTGATFPQHFIDCYIRNGGLSNIGNPLADAHWASWNPFRAEVQDFNGSVLGDSTIVDTEGASTANPACFMYGAINVEYHNVGGPNSGLGYPLLDQRSVPTGGWQLDCQLGRIYLRSGTGVAYSVDGPIFAYYYVSGETGGALHWPLSSVRPAGQSPQGSNGNLQLFEYGVIYNSGQGTWSVGGPAYTEYERLGGTVCPLGFPASDLRPAGRSPQGSDGNLQVFEGGAIYNSGQGTWGVYGPVYAEYDRLGGTVCPLGFVASELRAAGQSPQGTSGNLQVFEGGGIYKSSQGTWGVFGPIYTQYAADGGTVSHWGFPKSSVRSAGGQLLQDFEGGTISTGDAGTSTMRLSARVISAGGSAQIEVTITNGGQGTAHGVEVSRLQLGLASADGGSWQIGDLGPSANAKQTFTFTPGFGSKKVSLLTCNVVVGGVTTRLRFKVVKP
jgi:hypothetical protein